MRDTIDNGQERREGKARPILGNSPHDRPVSRGISSSSKRVCGDPFPVTPVRPLHAFFRHDGIYRSDVVHKPSKPGAGYRLPLVGPEPQSKDATGGTTAPCSSSAMSSGRLFLDRVARQQSPSLLHRQVEHNTHSSGDRTKGDISTLP